MGPLRRLCFPIQSWTRVIAVIAAHAFTFNRKSDGGSLTIRMISSSCSDRRSAEIKGSELGASSNRTKDQGSCYTTKSWRLPDYLSDEMPATLVRSLIVRDQTAFRTVRWNLCQPYSTFHMVFSVETASKILARRNHK